MLGLIFDRTRDTCLNLRMKHLSHRKPKFNKISWIKENVKILGVHYGYNVDNDKIWKDIIDRMKNCDK
jgi:hypothetical protein